MNNLSIPQAAGMATCVVVDSVMAPEDAFVFSVPAGTTVRSLVPKTRFPVVCRIDGQWALREDWDYELEPGGVVEFISYPQGGGGDGGSDAGRIVLTIAAIYLATMGQPWLLQATGTAVGSSGAAALAALSQMAAVALVNALVPAETGNNAIGSQAAGNSYSANLAGNQAKIEQPIPVLYGRNKTFPDFAAEPYSTYDENDDQYYHALLCLGQGDYTIESWLIDDTNITNFSEVSRAVLPPGTLPTLVSGLITVATEVTGNSITEGRYIGPFVGCKPKTKVNRLGIDVSFSRGLAAYDAAGVPGNKTVTWRVEYRAVDDFGAGLTLWTVVANESLTAAQTKPLRRSYEYEMPAPPGYTGPLPYSCRPQVRLVRTNPFDDNSRVANSIEWIGLRCYIDAPLLLCPTATYLEIKMRATEQLSGLTQRRIAVISRRKLRQWTGSAWTAPAETRSAAWALADKWTNAAYGDKYPEDRCDLDGLHVWAATLAARQDRFDGVFDQTYDSAQADQMIAQSGRAMVFRRNGVMTISRDEVKDMPVTGYSARNMLPNSLSISYAFAHESTPDGVIVEYWDNRVWDWREILCPAPTVVTPVRPVRMRLFGVTGKTHAEREGIYQAANSYYRRKFPTFSTELEGMLPAFGSAVVFSPNLKGWGVGGDLVDYDYSLREVKMSEPGQWVTGGSHYLTLFGRGGRPDTPQLVTRGQSDYHALLPFEPTFTLSLSQADEERTRYVFSAGAPHPSILRVLSIRNSAGDDGVRSFVISGVTEDNRVHLADNALLPTDGVIQDDVDNAGDDGSGSGLAVVPYIEDGVFGATAPAGGTSSVEIQLQSDGKTEIIYEVNGSLGYEYPVGQWLLDAPRPTADTGLFESRATLLSGLSTGVFDTWQLQSTDRVWKVSAVGEGALGVATIRFELRDVLTGTIQASAVVTISAAVADSGG